jgi:hypothetical protein
MEELRQEKDIKIELSKESKATDNHFYATLDNGPVLKEEKRKIKKVCLSSAAFGLSRHLSCFVLLFFSSLVLTSLQQLFS